ncbi:class I SAM-dependent DNA methyltransferase (plasmid) [Pseudomonas sp. FeN3W]|nr:class I SAM-dependent DNA methyltransferase [Pseudomonas sp. FeN3W]
MSTTRQKLFSTIWSIAENLRGSYKANDYRRVIIPFTLLRRMECVLEDTREEVAKAYEALEVDSVSDLTEEQVRDLTSISGHQFFSSTRITFSEMNRDKSNLYTNILAYCKSFNPSVLDIYGELKFSNEIVELQKLGILEGCVRDFSKVDLHENEISNHDMGLLFEELLRQFNDLSPAGEQYTPRDAIDLMMEILLAPDVANSGSAINTEYKHVKLYDPTSGTGGILSAGQDKMETVNPKLRVKTYGQEINPETYAICKADMLIRGQEIKNIRLGNTLMKDLHPDESFDYMGANPPYGVDWKNAKSEVEAELSSTTNRFKGGLPRVSDGQMLFTQHLLSKMKPIEKGGSRIGVVHSGSPLFNGDAGSGESEIRRYLLENDYLDAIVALPTDMFYNTGIGTFILFLTNRKEANRQGKVQLIDARDLGSKMRKPLGSKRMELTDETISQIKDIYMRFEPSKISKIFSNDDFSFRKISIERPLRIKGIDVNRAYSTKEIKALLEEFGTDESAPRVISKIYPKSAVAQPLYGLYNAVVNGKQVVVSYASDKSLKESESIPFGTCTATYFTNEVLVHAPDAWIDEAVRDDKDGKVGKVGTEISFNRYFYQFKKARSSDEIDFEIKELTAEFMSLLGEVAV